MMVNINDKYKLDENDEKILHMLSDDSRLLWKEIGGNLGISANAARKQEGYDTAKEHYGNWNLGFNQGWNLAKNTFKDYDKGFGDGFESGWNAALENKGGEV